MRKPNKRILVNFISSIGLVLCVIFTIIAWRTGFLTSQEKMESAIARAGILGPIVFVTIQIIQVIVPIIPGGVSCLVGVLMFGSLQGFLLNYIGICSGSMIVFGLSKVYGRRLMEHIFSKKSIAKYEQWTNTKDRFAKLFTIAILLPVAPDDMLCFLAGTTAMSWRQFITIILICKPAGLAIYSLGLVTIFNKVTTMI